MNFHGWIAVPLEHILRDVFGFEDRPMGTVFDADAIEEGFFYDAMCLVLAKKKITNWEEFANKYSNEINEYDLEKKCAIFEEFENLIK